MTSSAAASRSPSRLQAALASALVPGAGQFLVGKRYRGASILLTVGISLLTVLWYGEPIWYTAPGIVWLWNVFDAAALAGGPGRSAALPLLAVLGMAYGIGVRVTEINPLALTQNMERAASILRPMMHPDFIAHRAEENAAWVELQVPCGPNPPSASHQQDGKALRVTPDCGNPGDTMILLGSGFWPDARTELYWRTEIGDTFLLGEGFVTPLYVTTDAAGDLQSVFRVPVNALSAAPDKTLPQPHRVYARQTRDLPGYELSTNGGYVLQGILQTIAMALMATTLGMLGAVPISFLAARNLMGGNALTLAVYYLTRTILNIIRSLEPLIIAIVFVVVVGLGPFAGVIAITVHTIAALAKLFSEAIEGIDPGPLEAIRATGAGWAHVVRYAVIPQIVPPFASFTIYRWDINVRSSTIIGFVGGGGIGFFLYQWIFKGDFRAVSASFIAIAIVVVALDYVSAKVRARLV